MPPLVWWVFEAEHVVWLADRDRASRPSSLDASRDTEFETQHSRFQDRAHEGSAPVIARYMLHDYVPALDHGASVQENSTTQTVRIRATVQPRIVRTRINFVAEL